MYIQLDNYIIETSVSVNKLKHYILSYFIHHKKVKDYILKIKQIEIQV